MAKQKTKGIKGYGMKSPWDFTPSDTNTRGNSTPVAGTYYGTGMKNPIGKVRGSTVGATPLSKKKLSKPPKSLA